MAAKQTSWRVWAGALGIVLGGLGVAYGTMCPKGFVRFSGYEQAGSFSCIDYGGISTPEHYLALKNRGRVGFFGAPLAGEGGHPFLMRTEGEVGKWLCGRAKSASFSLNDGEAVIEGVSVILDEATAPRGGKLSIAGLAGGVFGDDCPSTGVTIDGDVLQVHVELSGMSGGASVDYKRVDASMSGGGLRLAAQVDLAEPWPERGDVEREVTYAWVRLSEVIDGKPVRRIAVSGAGSRLVRKDGCAKLELENVTPLGVCSAEVEGRGKLELSW